MLALTLRGQDRMRVGAWELDRTGFQDLGFVLSSEKE